MTGQRLFDAMEPLIRIALDTKEIQISRKFKIRKRDVDVYGRMSECVWYLYCPYSNDWIPTFSFERAVRFLGYELRYHSFPGNANDHSDLH